MAKKKKKTAKKKPEKRVKKAARRVTRPPKRKAARKKAKFATNRRPEPRALMPPVAPPPSPPGVIMEFTKDENSPADVRVTLSYPTHVALPLGYPTGKSDPRAPDSRVPATIFVMVPNPVGGNRTATIAVTNSRPSVLRVTVPEGDAQATEVTELTVRRENG